MNKVILIGNLGQNPELRYTQSGMAVCNLNLATSRRFKDRNGNATEEVQWHRIVVWDKQATACNQYLKVGHKVAIEGDLQYRKWKDQHGQDRISAEVVARSVEFLTPQSKGGADGGTAPSQPTTQPASQQVCTTTSADDDLPF